MDENLTNCIKSNLKLLEKIALYNKKHNKKGIQKILLDDIIDLSNFTLSNISVLEREDVNNVLLIEKAYLKNFDIRSKNISDEYYVLLKSTIKDLKLLFTLKCNKKIK